MWWLVSLKPTIFLIISHVLCWTEVTTKEGSSSPRTVIIISWNWYLVTIIKILLNPAEKLIKVRGSRFWLRDSAVQPSYKTSDLPELWSSPNSFHWTFIIDIDLCRVGGKIKILSKPCFSDLVKHNNNYPIPDNLMIFLVFRFWFNCIMDWQKLQSTDQSCGEPRRNLVTVSETDSNMTRWDGTFLIRSGLVDLNIKPGYWGDNHNSHPRHQSLKHTTKTQSSEGRERWEIITIFY